MGSPNFGVPGVPGYADDSRPDSDSATAGPEPLGEDGLESREQPSGGGPVRSGPIWTVLQPDAAGPFQAR